MPSKRLSRGCSRTAWKERDERRATTHFSNQHSQKSTSFMFLLTALQQQGVFSAGNRQHTRFFQILLTSHSLVFPNPKTRINLQNTISQNVSENVHVNCSCCPEWPRYKGSAGRKFQSANEYFVGMAETNFTQKELDHSTTE